MQNIDYSVNRNIAEVIFNSSKGDINLFSLDLLYELNNILGSIEDNKNIKFVLFKSKKVNSYNEGLYLKELLNMHNDEIKSNLIMVHKVFERVSKLNSIAIINGRCYNGGLEFILACKYKIATKNSSFGFTHSNIGILPTLGGSYKLLSMLGIDTSINMISSGNTIDAKEAYSLNIIDEYCDGFYLNNVIDSFLKNFQSYNDVKKKSLLENNFGLYKSYKFFKVGKEKKSTYNNPIDVTNVINMFKKCHKLDTTQKMNHEIDRFIKVLKSNEVKNLMAISSLENETIKKYSKVSKFKFIDMFGNSDLAYSFANSEFKLRVHYKNFDKIEKLYKDLRLMLGDNYKKDCLDNMTYSVNENIYHSDLVIESIKEEYDDKVKLYKELQKQKFITTIATNSSVYTISDLVKELDNKNNFIGLHFMPFNDFELVEVVPTEFTDEKLVDDICTVVVKMQKYPMIVNDTSGFLINRILIPFILEALHLLDEGFSYDEIDTVIEEFGFKYGPFKIINKIKLDVIKKIALSIDSKKENLPKALNSLIESGQKFFYKNKKTKINIKKFVKTNKNIDSDIVEDRLIYMIINETLNYYKNGNINDYKILDFALVKGIGFPPSKGGIFSYIKDNKTTVLEKMETLSKENNRYNSLEVLRNIVNNIN